MEKRFSVDEKVAIASYRQVSESSDRDADALNLGARALCVLSNPGLEGREAILSRIVHLGKFIDRKSDESEQDIEAMLQSAADCIGGLEQRARNIATGAEETAQQIEANGLPYDV